ncbi:MAG: hypothetical protein E7610_01030 [Ruminococcaceae bacterium]|nr:hypothetical protein [Oscillospiraceae bacterium]
MTLSQSIKKRLCIALASLLLLSSAAVLVGCGETTDSPGSVTNNRNPSSDGAETDGEDHRFDGINYHGREFRIYTSINKLGSMGNSNFLIEGDPDLDGNLVNDAVMERNVAVEEALGVKLVFIPADVGQMEVQADIKKYSSGGLDEFDLIINDIFGLGPLVISGHFRNVLDPECEFDFDRPYWYRDFMEDLRMMDGYQYVLAGDFFADILRSAHLLLLNKDLYQDYYNRSADEVYDLVANYEWTYDKMNEIITDKYVDLNLNNTVDRGDRFGYINGGSWGWFIPFSVSGNPPYIVRDEEGVPSFSLHEGDRANTLAAKMGLLIHNESTSLEFGDGTMLNAFTNGECLIASGERMGSLENPILRQMESDAAVLPYPLLFSSDEKYVTSAHDTTEMGFILTTSKDMAFISVVTEVLNRETAKTVVPKYYRESLQLQCVDDEKASAMLDIIHDNFDNSFILAYNNALGNTVFDAIYTAAHDNREFSVVYKGIQRAIDKKLNQFINQFRRQQGI